MKNPDRLYVEKSLTELSDEQAVAIMEGRDPALDEPQLDDAARQFVRGILEEPNAPSSETGGGGNVVQLIVRQPWMKLAAAVMLGVGLSTLVRVPMQVADLTPDSSVASANGVYLETTRSAAADVPTIEIIDGEPWISFVAYPDFEGAQLLRLRVERARNQEGQSLATIRSGEWEVLVDAEAGLGTRDSVVVTVDADLLAPGYHRLSIVSDSGDVGSFETSYMFVVTR
jgi:hypothetical protein